MIYQVICIAATLITTSYALLPVVDLSGNDWVIVNSNGSVRANSTVPGQVQLDLLRSKLIPEPMYRTNDDTSAWIAYDSWTYSKAFILPPSPQTTG